MGEVCGTGTPRHVWEGGGSEEAVATHALVRNSFGKLLTKILTTTRCYDDLPHFGPIFDALVPKGALIPLLAEPVRRMIKHPIDSLESMDLSGVDLATQGRFFAS